jgi:hypothetical protein
MILKRHLYITPGIFGILFFSCLTGLSAQDTAIYKRNDQMAAQLCNDSIRAISVGCGHPDYQLSLCAGHQLEKLEIYNRWGAIVLETSDPLFKWNAKDQNGNLLQAGAYFYKIYYKDGAGNSKISTQSISLLP